MGKFDLRNKYKSDANPKATHLKEIVKEKEYLVKYEELEITDNSDLDLLKSYEEESVLYYKQASKNIYEVSRIFYNARNLLSKYGNGKFSKWFEEIGFKKGFVYDCISRYELLLTYKEVNVEHNPDIKNVTEITEEEEEVINLPIRTINKMKKLDLTRDDIIEIVDSVDQDKTISEIRAKKEEEKISTPEIVEDIKTEYSIKEEIKLKQREVTKIISKQERLIQQIEKLEKEYSDLELNVKELKNEISKLQSELNDNFK